MPTAIDLTGLDVTIVATVRGGTRRLNLRDSAGALNLTGVTSFVGERLATRESATGSGTAVTWPVVDATGGGVSVVIAAAIPVGSYWVYASATVAGSTVEISGPLRITEF